MKEMTEKDAEGLSLEEISFYKLCKQHLCIFIGETDEGRTIVELSFRTSKGKFITLDKDYTD